MITITAEQLFAAASWATGGEDMAPVTLRGDAGMLMLSQGDEYAAFDTGGEPGSDEYEAAAPLDPEPAPQIAGFSPEDAREVILLAGMLRDHRLITDDVPMRPEWLALLDRAATAWQEAVAAEAGDGEEPGPNDAPSPAAQLLQGLLDDAAVDPEETTRYWFGEVHDTCPAGIGEAVVHVRDNMVNAEHLIIAVDFRTAQGLNPIQLCALWSQLVSAARERQATRP